MSKNGVLNEAVQNIRNYDYEVVCGAAADSFPEEYEIPRENTGALRNQGDYSTCLACVIAQIAQAMWKSVLGEDRVHSEWFVYGGFRKENEKTEGMFPQQSMKMWKEIGTVPIEYFDKKAEMPDIKNMVDQVPELKEVSERYQISGFVELTGSQKDKKIKDALTKYPYGLVGISPDWFPGGCHAIMITGWNDKENKYKFKNSWGEEYGKDGFSEIPKNEIGSVFLPLIDPIVLPFEDVKESDWSFKYIQNMYFNGLMKGTSDTTFEPTQAVTREELAVFGYNLAKRMDERFQLLNKVLNTAPKSKSSLFIRFKNFVKGLKK